MPTLKVNSKEELEELVNKHREAIENGEYDIGIPPTIVTELDESPITLLASYCPASRKVLAKSDCLSSDVYMTLTAKPEDILDEIIDNPGVPREALGFVWLYLFNQLDLMHKKQEQSLEESGLIYNIFVEPIYNKMGRLVQHENTEIAALITLLDLPIPPEVMNGSLDRIMSWPDKDELGRVIGDLAKHTSPQIRAAVARGSQVPRDILELLAIDSDMMVRAAVAQNVQAPQDILERLAKDADMMVRAAVFENQNIPDSLFQDLSRDKELTAWRNKNASNVSAGECFVATAVYGDPSSSELILLRRYRDQVLDKHAWGRCFVSIYYSISPFLARMIGRSEWARQVVRRYFLDPVVRTIRQKFSD